MRRRLERWVHAVWYEGGTGGWVLRPLSWLYRGVIVVRQLLYRLNWFKTFRPATPVIIVGNITAGGVGKTPLVIWLVHALQQKGFQPAVITRGYGGTTDSSVVVDPSSASPMPFVEQIGDEAMMMLEKLSVPIAVGSNRTKSAKMLAAHPVNVIVCDDGLQHYALARDIEICVVDGRRQFGNGRLLPSGPLREPVERLRSVDFVIEHHDRLTDQLSGMALANPTLCNLLTGERQSLSSFAGQTVHAVAGVGNPERFFASLERAGLTIYRHAFDDHHRFTEADFEFDDSLNVLMTEKDAVKCRAIAREGHYAVCVEAQLSSDLETALLDAVVAAGATTYE